MAVTFDREDILSALTELVSALVARGNSNRIRIVGGAAIAIQFGRFATTSDVDALYRSDPVIEEVAREIAASRGWPDSWLNDDVKMWASHFDTLGDWTQIHVEGDVTVSVASARLLLAMKLRAGRGRRDAPDIAILLEECDIGSVVEAVDLFDAYYPEDEIAPPAMAQLCATYDSPE